MTVSPERVAIGCPDIPDGCDHGTIYRCFENHETVEGCSAFYNETEMCCVGPDECPTCHGVGYVAPEGYELALPLSIRRNDEWAEEGEEGPIDAILDATGHVVARIEIEESDVLLQALIARVNGSGEISLPVTMQWDKEWSELHARTYYWPWTIQDGTGEDILRIEELDEAAVAAMLALVNAPR
jgi:hypothetical protein